MTSYLKKIKNFHKAVFLSQSGITTLGTAEIEFPLSLPVSKTGTEDAVTCSYSIRANKTKKCYSLLWQGNLQLRVVLITAFAVRKTAGHVRGTF